MKDKKFGIISALCLLIVQVISICNISNAQNIGSLFMFKDNYQSQMLNPAYMRNDKAIEIALPGLAGLTLGNNANFRIADLVTRQPSGDMAIDFVHFYNAGESFTNLNNQISVPYLYVGVPLRKGLLSFYIKEQIHASAEFKTSAIEFLLEGNINDQFKTYNTEDAFLKAIGYRELAAGYATRLNENVTMGIRGKILFGVILVDLRDWAYEIKTSGSGDLVEFSSTGTGIWSLPHETRIRNNRIKHISTENFMGTYLSRIDNPGFAIDFGIDWAINENSRLSFTASDLGGIIFSNNAYEIYQDDSYSFQGLDISNSLDINKGKSGYVDPRDLMIAVKGNVRGVFRSFADSATYVKGLVPRTAVHYQYDYSPKISFGITNQTSFLNHTVWNTLSVSTKQNLGGFSFFENVNLYGINFISVGGGVHWEGNFGQLMLATDNLLAVYHPASQKSFSVTLGASFLINKPKNRKPKSKFSPHFPFYEMRMKD